MDIKSKISYTILLNIILFLTAFGTSIIISRILGPDGLGLYKYILTVAFTITLFSSFGLPDMLNVKLAKRIIFLKDYILTILIGVMPVFFIVGGILFYYLFYKDNISEKPMIWVALFFCLIYQLNLIFQQTIHSLDKIIKYQIFELSKQLIFLIGAIVLFLLHYLSIVNLFIVLIFANSIAIVYVLYLLFYKKNNTSQLMQNKKDETHEKPHKIKLVFSKELISNSFRAYINNILTFLTTRVDIFFLKLIVGLGFYEIGIYTLAITLVEKLWLIPESIRSVLYLELSNQRRGDDFVARIIRLMIAFSVISGCIVAILSFFLIPFVFGEDFRDSVLPFLFLLPGAMFFCYIKILGTYFVVREMLSVNTYMTFLIAVINIIFCLILIPKYSYLGAAIAKSIAFIIGSFYHVNKFRLISNTKTINLLFIQKQDYYFLKNIFKKVP